MKYSIDAYHRCILPRYILPFCFGNLNSRDYHGDSLNAMFSWFPNYFLPFLLVFMYFSPDVSKVSFGVSPVFPQCYPCFLLQILQLSSSKLKKLFTFGEMELSSSNLEMFIQFYIVLADVSFAYCESIRGLEKEKV